jgi:hypothetical protein
VRLGSISAELSRLSPLGASVLCMMNFHPNGMIVQFRHHLARYSFSSKKTLTPKLKLELIKAPFSLHVIIISSKWANPSGCSRNYRYVRMKQLENTHSCCWNAEINSDIYLKGLHKYLCSVFLNDFMTSSRAILDYLAHFFHILKKRSLFGISGE